MRASVSPESLLCSDSIPTAECVSSRSLGWRALLLDVHSGVRSHEPYVCTPTRDPRIGVSLSGRYSCEVLINRQWRRDEHGPGTVMVHRVGEVTPHRWPRPRDADFRLALVYIPATLFHEAADHFRRAGQESLRPQFRAEVARDEAISNVVLSLVRSMEIGMDDMYAQDTAAWLCTHLLTHHASQRFSGTRRRSFAVHERRVNRAIEYMRHNYAEQLSLDVLAGLAFVSKFHFTRVFKEITGSTPHQYLTQIRLTHAARLLQETDMPIGVVGLTSGFHRPTYFSNAFRARYGMSPNAFRTRVRFRI